MQRLVLLASSVMVMGVVVKAQTREPQGFIFDCNHDVCPDGPYQELCPQCDMLDYSRGAECFQCYCFDANKKLQPASTLRYAQNCASIGVNSTGSLVCDKTTNLRGKKTKEPKSKSTSDESATSVTPTVSGTKAPTVGTNLFHVTFDFNCIGGTCPTGEYQQFCPLCVVNTDSTPPNDPRPSISCQCFNGNGQMLSETGTMWNFQLCPKIVVDFGGILGCVGAPKGSDIQVYGGRRALAKIPSLEAAKSVETTKST